jgi:hypothetical protein
MKAQGSAVLLALCLLVSPSIGLSDDKPAPPRLQAQASQSQPSITAMPVYKPPLRGAPGGRVGGGTRGGGDRETFVLSVLAPDHTGLTVNEQPALYWFISTGSSYPVEVSIVDPSATQPLLETRIAPPIQAGVHRIRLADQGIRLAPGVGYRWYVAVVADTNRRSKDILAGGTIERVERPEALASKLAQAGKTEVPAVYAEAGFWYDAIATISDLIETSANDPALRQQRAAMLSQVGLPAMNE